MHLPLGLRATARTLARHTGEPESTWLHRLTAWRDHTRCPTIVECMTVADGLRQDRREFLEQMVRDWWVPVAYRPVPQPDPAPAP